MAEIPGMEGDGRLWGDKPPEGLEEFWLSMTKSELEQRFPGVQVEFATDCVIDNASSGELLALAADAVTGPTANTVEIVSDVISRPATIECLAREGLPVLLTRL